MQQKLRETITVNLQLILLKTYDEIDICLETYNPRLIEEGDGSQKLSHNAVLQNIQEQLISSHIYYFRNQKKKSNNPKQVKQDNDSLKK